MFPRNLFNLWLASVLTVCSWCSAADFSAPSTSALLTPEVRIRVQTYARESTPIQNPIRWVQFISRLPEGTRVKKGETVFQVDLSSTHDALRDLENRLEERRNSAELRLSEFRKDIIALEDRMEELKDSRSIQTARLAYLRSLPREEDVSIARGRLNVAEQNLKAAQREVEKAKERLQENLVSPAVAQEADLDARKQQAQTIFARRELRTAELPASTRSMRIVETQIENLDLEIDKLTLEIKTQRRLYDIEEASQLRRIKELTDQRAERQEELKHGHIPAPRDGVLLYSARLKRELAQGGQLPKDARLAEIPHPGSVALQGEIPEQMRHLFEVGDPAEVVLNMYPDTILKGRLDFVSPFSRDIREEAEDKTGVKVVDVVLTLDNPPNDLPLGVYGWADLRAESPREGAVVPISWVRFRGGKPYVSVQGTYQAVKGVVGDTFFQFSSPHPALDTLQETGEWEQNTEERPALQSDLYVAAGELSPVESVAVDVPRMRAWDIKVTWIHPENSLVKEGEPLVRLDSERIRDQAENRESEARQAAEERESAEEELTIKLREQTFKVTSAENRLERSQLEKELVELGLDSTAAHQAVLNVETAELELERAQTELARMNRHPEFTPEATRTRQSREVDRRELRLEQAVIRKEEVFKGATEVEKSQASLNVLQEAARLAETRANAQQAVSNARSRLRWRKRREARRQEQLEEARNDLASMEITAPVSGLVKYEKIWDGVKRSKLKTGMRVWRGSQIISLSDAQEVFVEIPVPERYVRHLKLDMPVQIRIPSEGNLQWAGRVTRFAEILEPAENPPERDDPYGDRESAREQVLTVRVTVDSVPEDNLKPGAIAHVIFPFVR